MRIAFTSTERANEPDREREPWHLRAIAADLQIEKHCRGQVNWI
jgi:hypothetical protein